MKRENTKTPIAARVLGAGSPSTLATYKEKARSLLPILCSITLCACANLQTIGRSSSLPKEGGRGKVIHLDAQQRLLVVNKFQEYCAEPSPDALAAYASSLGFGISDPSKRAASLAQALGSSAGSIGLRTQSITIMRDALYRMCEAYANKAIGHVQMATLLGRSQDLTAVVLATEQLTGAVAANQVILTGTSSAGASASLLSNQELLDAARKDEEAKKKALQEAEDQQKTLETSIGDKKIEVAHAQAAHDETVTDEKPEGDLGLKTALENRQGELSALETLLIGAKTTVDTQKKLLAESQKVRETVESIRDSALTNAVATTTSAGQFSIPVQRKELSKEATDAIATAVTSMVEQVVKKSYVVDGCMALLSSSPDGYAKWEEPLQDGYLDTQNMCMELIAVTARAESAAKTVQFESDDSTNRIALAMDNDNTLRPRLNAWLKNKGIDISTTLLLYGSKHASLREQAIEELSIK